MDVPVCPDVSVCPHRRTRNGRRRGGRCQKEHRCLWNLFLHGGLHELSDSPTRSNFHCTRALSRSCNFGCKDQRVCCIAMESAKKSSHISFLPGQHARCSHLTVVQMDCHRFIGEPAGAALILKQGFWLLRPLNPPTADASLSQNLFSVFLTGFTESTG